MRLISLVTLVILYSSPVLKAQHSINEQKKNTYAVVIGISNYSSPEIPSLQFAHKDAEAFASFLHSKAGGTVPVENIRLLVNEQATMVAVYQSLDWLVGLCGKDDLVYIFFAGHGDMENTTLFKLGFLLTANTPPNNYINQSLRIEDLNNYANTLSAANQSKVVIITDACHSGKLAEKQTRGSFLVGDQLRATQNKEVRIAACAADQLSNENEAWGGGRGVFSWYFINGLKGLAEKQSDGFVNAKEMNEYLDSSFKLDPFLKENKLIQTPVLKTEDMAFKLSVVDTSILVKLKLQLKNEKKMQESFMIPEQPYDYFFRLVKDRKLLEKMDYTKLAVAGKEKIPMEIIRQATQFFVDSTTGAKFDELVSTLNSNKPLLKRFSANLVDALHTQVSEAIQLFLKADEAELEKRRYYNARLNNYDAYVNMLGLALELSDSGSYLFRTLTVLKFYFTGVAARLKIPLVEKRDSLIGVAFGNQLKALALESNAAYIYNELGLLYNIKKDYEKAKEHFMKAIPIAPGWSIPYGNLIGVYTKLNQFEKAEAAYQKTKELQPGLEGIYFNYGALNETKRNFLVSEEMYRKSATNNNIDYLPFERLGFVYLHTTDYAAADSFFNEAAIRKGSFFTDKPKEEPKPQNLGNGYNPNPTNNCSFNKSEIKENDLISYFLWAQEEAKNHRNANAINLYRTIIRKDNRHFMAFHYLGKLYEEENKYKEAALMYSFAIRTHMDNDAFKNYKDSLRKIVTYDDLETSFCIYMKFTEAYYKAEEDHYLLGDLFAKWNHFDEAVQEYKTLILKDSNSIDPHLRLADLYEKFERYEEAEKSLLTVLNLEKKIFNIRLERFYYRMTEKEPAKSIWFYKTGSLYYGSGYNHSAISYLHIADSMAVSDTRLRIDINDKLGDLYARLDSTIIANKHYEVAAGLQPGNAGTRMKMIETYCRTWQFSRALQLLDSLNEAKEINFQQQLLLAKFYIHASQFEKADRLLANADSVHPFALSTITALKARRFMLSREYAKAIPFYTALQQSPGEDRFILYSLARIHAFAGRKGKAMQYLLKSCDSGFRYGYVLRYDPAWKAFAKDQQWLALVNKYPILE